MFRQIDSGTGDTSTTIPTTPSRQSVANGGTVMISLSAYFQTIILKSTGGAVALASQPFGAAQPLDATRVIIIGDSSTDSVQFNSAAYNAGGQTCYAAGGLYITQAGDVTEWEFCKALGSGGQWIQTSVS